MNKNFKNYIIFWGSQSLSQLGSSMTSYALIIWVFQETNSTMGVSLLTFFTYVPYIFISLFAGAFVDRYDKKKILMYSRVSGMKSFSSSLITVVTPMLATFITSFCGIQGVILFDISTFIFAFIYLKFFIEIPQIKNESNNNSIINESMEGFNFIKRNKGLLYLILSIALMNFLSRLTYENILPAMILSRSNESNTVLGSVSAVIGIGGIIGGLIVSIKRIKLNRIKLIYFSAALSFLLGDTFMAIGSDVYMWMIAGFFASFPLPFLDAGLNEIMYEKVPKAMQGRVFAARNSMQFFTIPIGLILGGALAEYVFEPLMNSGFILVKYLEKIVGEGPGSGMALMFLITGTLGLVSCFICYRNKYIQSLYK